MSRRVTMTERQDELAEALSKAMGKSKQELVDLWSAQTPMRRMAAAEEITIAIRVPRFRTGVLHHRRDVASGRWLGKEKSFMIQFAPLRYNDQEMDSSVTASLSKLD